MEPSGPIRRGRRAAAVAFAATLVLTACSPGGEDASTAPAGGSAGGGTAALDFTATDLQGGPFDGSSLEGRDTVLWFWAPWCTSCRIEAPDVVEAAAEFDGRVEVIGVPGRGDVGAMQGFVEETGTSGLRHVVDADGSVWSDFGVIGQPAFAFIDDDGTAEVFVGGLGRDDLVERMGALAED